MRCNTETWKQRTASVTLAFNVWIQMFLRSNWQNWSDGTWLHDSALLCQNSRRDSIYTVIAVSSLLVQCSIRFIRNKD